MRYCGTRWAILGRCVNELAVALFGGITEALGDALEGMGVGALDEDAVEALDLVRVGAGGLVIGFADLEELTVSRGSRRRIVRARAGWKL
jgi:hypothetical protein